MTVKKFFRFFGINISGNEREYKTDCPFCEKVGHFYINTERGLWRCFRCDAEGNPLSFARRLWKTSRLAAKEADYNELAEERGLPAEGLIRFGIVPSVINGEWLAPGFTAEGRVGCVYKIVYREGKPVALAMPGGNVYPFAPGNLNPRAKTVWITEGVWDAIALDAALRQTRAAGGKYARTADESKSLGAEALVIGIPGAATFPKRFLPFLAGKTVRVAYDNDHPKQGPGGPVLPGWDGTLKVARSVAKGSVSIRRLYAVKWGPKGYDPELPDGFDVRDLVARLGKTKAVKRLYELQTPLEIKPEENESETLTPIPRETFAELLDDWAARLYLSQPLRDTLTVALACCISTELPGEQLWIRIIGPPGSGKTTIAEALSASRDYTFPISIQTGFHSGWLGGRSDGDDPSLIPKINGKTVIIKDADTLLQSPARDRILSELRDIYDGTSRAAYRNRISVEYKGIRTTFLLCGTDALRRLNRSGLGERFLDVEVFADERSRNEYLDRSLENTMQGIAGTASEEQQGTADMVYLKRVTAGFLETLKDQIRRKREAGEWQPPGMPESAKQRIKALAELVGYLRAKVERERDEILWKPKVEIATRLVGQLAKLAICLAVVKGRPVVDESVLRIIRKVARDTAGGYLLDIVDSIYQHRETGRTFKALAADVGVSEPTLRKTLDDAMMLGIVENGQRPMMGGGRVRICRLTPKIRKLYRIAFKGGKRNGN